jgi:hypothetical protein
MNIFALFTQYPLASSLADLKSCIEQNNFVKMQNDFAIVLHTEFFLVQIEITFNFHIQIIPAPDKKSIKIFKKFFICKWLNIKDLGEAPPYPRVTR